MGIGLGIVIAALAGAPSNASTAETQISFISCGGMICMPVTLSDGKSHVMLLDTGNVSSWMSSKTAKALGKSLDPVTDDGKPVPGLFRVGSENFALGGTSLSARFLAFDDALVGELPRGVEGGIAYTALKDRVIEIDYPRHALRIGGAALNPTGAARGAIKLITFGAKGPPIVTIDGLSIDGRAFAAQFDTGFTGTLVVYDQAIEQLGLREPSRHGKPKFFPYTDGGVTMNETSFGRISFGAESLTTSPATVYFPGAGKNPVHQPDALFEATVGNALFADRVVTLDFKSMAVYVRPAR
jgi:hypothetical protein